MHVFRFSFALLMILTLFSVVTWCVRDQLFPGEPWLICIAFSMWLFVAVGFGILAATVGAVELWKITK